MPRLKWSQEWAGGALPAVLTVNPNVSGDPQVPADWVELPGGGTLTYLDGSGQSQTITSAETGHVLRSTVRKLVSLSGASPNLVRAGTGPGPVQATADASAAASAAAAAASAKGMGVQFNQAADGSAGAVVAETYFGSILGPCNVDPTIVARGVAAASDTVYATKTFRLYRAGAVVKTWTMTTQITLGTGSWTDGAAFSKGDPFAALKGDYVTIQTSKASTGTQLPAHAVGLTIS